MLDGIDPLEFPWLFMRRPLHGLSQRTGKRRILKPKSRSLKPMLNNASIPRLPNLWATLKRPERQTKTWMDDATTDTGEFEIDMTLSWCKRSANNTISFVRSFFTVDFHCMDEGMILSLPRFRVPSFFVVIKSLLKSLDKWMYYAKATVSYAVKLLWSCINNDGFKAQKQTSVNTGDWHVIHTLQFYSGIKSYWPLVPLHRELQEGLETSLRFAFKVNTF